MKHTFYLLLLLALIGCSTKPQKEAGTSKSKLAVNGIEVDSARALVVNENCAIFIWPDSTEIAKMKAENSEDDFNTIMDDMVWYQSEAGMQCDNLNIKRFSCEKEFIALKGAGNNLITLKCRDIKGDMILFNINKKPVFKNSIDFNKDSVLMYFDR